MLFYLPISYYAPPSEMLLSFLLDAVKYHHVDKALFYHYFSLSGFNHFLPYTHIFGLYFSLCTNHIILLFFPLTSHTFFAYISRTGLCHSQFHILNSLYNTCHVVHSRRRFMTKWKGLSTMCWNGDIFLLPSMNRLSGSEKKD